MFYFPDYFKNDFLNIAKYWNCGVFIVFRTITEYNYEENISKLGSKFIELINTNEKS